MAENLTQMAEVDMKYVLEAYRASVLAVHTSVGLVWPKHRAAARLLRSAEALCRSAVALLGPSAKEVLRAPVGAPRFGSLGAAAVPSGEGRP